MWENIISCILFLISLYLIYSGCKQDYGRTKIKVTKNEGVINNIKKKHIEITEAEKNKVEKQIPSYSEVITQ
tara:strand:+ start:1328 stop:1543 length:216 start_codon:yes stop_codon:yes gene_type:complete